MEAVYRTAQGALWSHQGWVAGPLSKQVRSWLQVQTVHLLLSDLDLILFAVASAGQPTEPSVVSRPRFLVVFVSANTPTN